MNDRAQDKLTLFFVTTPGRMRTARFGAFFDKVDQGSLPHLSVPLVLKRREPLPIKNADGSASMGWTERCSEEDFLACAPRLASWGAGAWINIEGEIREADLRMLREDPNLGAIVSGHELTPDKATELLLALPPGSKAAFACENLDMLLGGAKILGALQGRLPAHIVIGSSYLSESSKIYDEMGLEKFRSLMRGLGKAAAALHVTPITTTNYCTFESSGAGDKSKAFVAEQVRYVSRFEGWNTITRFYSHLETSNETRRLLSLGEQAGSTQETP